METGRQKNIEFSQTGEPGKRKDISPVSQISLVKGMKFLNKNRGSGKTKAKGFFPRSNLLKSLQMDNRGTGAYINKVHFPTFPGLHRFDMKN